MTTPIAIFAPDTLAVNLKAAFGEVAESRAIAARLDAESDLCARYGRLPSIALYTANVLNSYLRQNTQPHVMHAALLMGLDPTQAMMTPKSAQTDDLWRRYVASIAGVCLPTYAQDLRQLVLAREIGENPTAGAVRDNAHNDHVPIERFMGLVHRSRNNIALIAHESTVSGAKADVLARAYSNHTSLFIARIEDEYPYMKSGKSRTASPGC